MFRGGLKALGPHFSVGNLSWADGGRELVFLGQWCHVDMSMGSESCGTGKAGGDRVAGVRTLNPASGGGRLGSGRLLLRVPKSMHRQVARAAARDGVSVNMFLVSAIAKELGRREILR